MKINNLKVNSFGNLNNKEIELSENINIIKGKNESGKSTLLKFIVDMFYGISKNKRGKEFSDYDRYKPWDTEEFSGKITYTLQNGEKYEVFRDFNKKNPKIYNERLEDISKEFNINKLTGNEFFVEQTKVDENMFLSTLVSMQQEVKLDRTSQNALIQKVANFASSGDDSISYKKTLEKINKKQIEEIGTDRTQGRPINIVKQEKEKIEKEKEELIDFKNRQYEIEETKNELENEIKEHEIKLSLFKEINLLNEKEKIENEKINFNIKIITENEEEINNLNLQKERIKEEIKNLNLENSNLEEERIRQIKNNISKIQKNNKNKNIITIIGTIVFIVLAIINFIFTKINYISQGALAACFVIILGRIIIFIKNKDKIKKETDKLTIESQKQENEELESKKNQLNKIETQIEILEKNIDIQKLNIEKIKEKNNLEFNLERENIWHNYSDKINIELDSYFSGKNLNYEISNLENKLTRNKLQLHSLELDKNNIIPKLEKLSFIEEQLEQLNEREEELLKSNQSIELVKEVLEVAYNKMKDSVTPKFTNNLSKNIEKISNGKYKNVKINDEEGIIVEKENGEYISAEKLSVGTIDQLYLSLRFAIIDEIADESMPIILDESFAYYDAERLKNILVYLSEEYKDNQIIIFTCTNREEEILNKEGIEYNLTIM